MDNYDVWRMESSGADIEKEQLREIVNILKQQIELGIKQGGLTLEECLLIQDQLFKDNKKPDFIGPQDC